jgi:glutathione S-transferase
VSLAGLVLEGDVQTDAVAGHRAVLDGDVLANDLRDPQVAKRSARTTPVLEHEPGGFLPESAAILAYLAEATHYLPTEPIERAEVVRWFVYEQTDVVPAWRTCCQDSLPSRRSASSFDAALAAFSDE